MRVPNRHEYMNVLLMLCVAACVCLLLTRPVGDEFSSRAEAPAKLPPGIIEVAAARRALLAMTIVTTDDFVRQRVPTAALPQGQQISSPVRIIGRVLAGPVVEGQILTESCFISGWSRFMSPGERWVRPLTVSFGRRSAPLSLCPGSVVDVVRNLRELNGSAGWAAMATTILRGIPVEAVEERGGSVQVTLLVTPKQYETLLSLNGRSDISLVMHNPHDKSTAKMSKSYPGWDVLQRPLDPGPDLPRVRFNEQYRSRPNARWRLNVIRGKESKTDEFHVESGDISTQH